MIFNCLRIKTATMDTEAKFEEMQKVLHELEELKSNQTAVIKKIVEIETPASSASL